MVITRGITANWGAHGPAGDRFYAFDKKTGELVWSSAPGDRPQDNTFSQPWLDFWGGKRPGNNDYANSVVALRAETGERVWSYQTVHHDVWDYDLPAQPTLARIDTGAGPRDVVIQPTKQGFVFVLDRDTGKPVWPIVERPVEQSTVKGEKTSPTQPFVTKPPPFDRQGVAIDDLIDFTSELWAEAIRIAKQYRLGPVFTPPSHSAAMRSCTPPVPLGIFAKFSFPMAFCAAQKVQWSVAVVCSWPDCRPRHSASWWPLGRKGGLIT